MAEFGGREPESEAWSVCCLISDHSPMFWFHSTEENVSLLLHLPLLFGFNLPTNRELMGGWLSRFRKHQSSGSSASSWPFISVIEQFCFLLPVGWKSLPSLWNWCSECMNALLITRQPWFTRESVSSAFHLLKQWFPGLDAGTDNTRAFESN